MNGIPNPFTSAREALRDEMGPEIAHQCSLLVCTGLVYREDFHHCEIVYTTRCQYAAAEAIAAWKETAVPDRREFEIVTALDLSEAGERVLAHLTDPANAWAPQHAAAALLTVAQTAPDAIRAAGLDI